MDVEENTEMVCLFPLWFYFAFMKFQSVDEESISDSELDNLFDNLLSKSSSAPASNAELQSKLEQYLSTSPENVQDALLWWVEMKS